MAMATTGGSGPAGRRWLAVPLAIAVLALIGLGASAESGDQFRNRVDGSGIDDSRFDPPTDDNPFGDRPLDGRPFDDRRGAGDGSPVPGSETRPGAGDGGSGAGGGGTGQGGDAVPVDVEIRSPDGSIGLDLDEDGSTARPADGSGDGPVVLRPDPDGDIGGVRITEDGRLEPVPTDELGPEDLLLRPSDEGGVDLVRPDGTVIELRSGPDGQGVVVTEVAPDGSTRELVPDANGEIPLDDDTSLLTAPPDGAEPWSPAPWRWIFTGIVGLALASLGLAGYLYLTRPEHPFGSDFVGPAGVPADRFEEFLTMLQADDDHPRAVRLAFLAAERGPGGVPSRLPTETPFEWSQRVAESHPDAAEPVTELATLFAMARFAPERPGPAERDRAVALLRQLHQRQRFSGPGPDEPVDRPGDRQRVDAPTA